MGKLIHLLGLAVLMPLSLRAQSATSIQPPATAQPETAASLAVTPPVEAVNKQVANQPSRYAGGDVGTYVDTLSKIFSIRSRTSDPFGQLQDPSTKPVKPKISPNNPAARVAAIPNTPYSEIVSQIRVTTVIPAEGRFLVGTRSFSTGDRFPIAFRGKNYQTQVAEVTSTRIVFRNVENSETGVLKLDMMPPGMSRGGGNQITAPGMQPARADAPLEIEGGPPQASGLN